MSDAENIQKLLELIYLIKRDILVMTEDLLENPYKIDNSFILDRVYKSLRDKQQLLDSASKFIQEKFPNFKCPDQDFINQSIGNCV